MPTDNSYSEKEEQNSRFTRFFGKPIVKKILSAALIGICAGGGAFYGSKISHNPTAEINKDNVVTEIHAELPVIKNDLHLIKKQTEKYSDHASLLQHFLNELRTHPPTDEEIEKVLEAKEIHPGIFVTLCIQLNNQMEEVYKNVKENPSEENRAVSHRLFSAYQILCGKGNKISSPASSTGIEN